MKLPRRQFLHLAAGAAALPAMSRIAKAQAYPSRPVRIIVPNPPSGPNDILARLMGQWLSERLGQPFIVASRAAEVLRRQRLTPSGHWPDRNPAAQQSPAVLRCAILSVGNTGASGNETARLHRAHRQRAAWPLAALAQQQAKV